MQDAAHTPLAWMHQHWKVGLDLAPSYAVTAKVSLFQTVAREVGRLP